VHVKLVFVPHDADSRSTPN